MVFFPLKTNGFKNDAARMAFLSFEISLKVNSFASFTSDLSKLEQGQKTSKKLSLFS
jgi:hypothetical protein